MTLVNFLEHGDLVFLNRVFVTINCWCNWCSV